MGTRMESRRLRREERPFDLRSCVAEAVDVVSAARKRLELTSLVDHRCPALVLGDSARLRQVLDSLLGNAVRFTAAGQVHLGVVLAGRKDGRLQVRFDVADTGIGIAAERIEGLLATSRSLVEAMGGTLTVASTVGLGSTFTFLTDLGNADDAGLPASPHAPAGRGAGAPLRILLAEDNRVNQRVATLMLRRLGHRVDVVDTGRQALDAVTGRRYDVVLMDLQMPEMDGLAATRAIRAAVPRPRQPRIVAMTARTLAADERACAEAGMDGCLSKPVRESDLAAALRPG